MFWSLSLQLMPGETVIEDSTGSPVEGLKPTYSVFLTNKRAVFRFDGLGSSMAQSFLYDEIIQAQPARRMFITYLNVKTRAKDYFLHTPSPECWAARLLETKKTVTPAAEPSAAPSSANRRTRDDLRRMLDTLRDRGILTDAEYEVKAKLLDQLKG
jgi:hypothetical protein